MSKKEYNIRETYYINFRTTYRLMGRYPIWPQIVPKYLLYTNQLCSVVKNNENFSNVPYKSIINLKFTKELLIGP